MRVPFAFNRLRAVIMTSLAFLILSAMLLIHVVTAKLTERDLINARIQSGRVLLQAAGIMAIDEQSNLNAGRKSKSLGTDFGRHMVSLLHQAGFSGIMIKDDLGSELFSYGDWSDKSSLGDIGSPQPARSTHIEFSRKTWGLFWLAPRDVILSSSLWAKGQFSGSVAVFSDLESLYEKIRASEPVILGYIGMNALILVLFGIYLLSRTVVRPINRLVSLTEKFDGAIPIMQKEEAPNNEIGRLSQSLNHMLRELNANERKLKENILSLETANQEIKRAQEEMVESEKMASVGRLATGVAHEIGNPLGIILGYIELLQRGDLSLSEQKDFLVRMESEINRINRIVRDLLDFSRPSTAGQHDINANEVLEEVLTILGPQPLFEKVQVRRLLEAKAFIVRISQDSLKQVFLNLIMNAVDAMAHERGCAGDSGESILTLESFNEEGFLIMRFSDTGCGMNPDDIKRIFDPFFTTKPPGKGTGLGLSICYTIMDQVGGRIRAESEPGRGSTIMIKMPLGIAEE